MRADVVHLFSEKGDEIIAPLFCGLSMLWDLGLEQMAYSGEKLLGVSRAIVYDVGVEFCPYRPEGLNVSLLVFSVGLFADSEP